MTLPTSRVDRLAAYERAPLPAGVTLRLDANEGNFASTDIALDTLREGGAELLRRYPDARPLEAMLGRHFDIEPSRVFVSAGADDVIDRCCRAYLASDSSLLIAEPGFEMFDQYAALCGARVVKVPWSPGLYPIDAAVREINEHTGVIALVTPNNPTGEVATLSDLQRLALAAPNALVILDHAYVEFADDDFTDAALSMPNVVVVRTFSKAWGLAGCRAGYALGAAPVIKSLRAAGGPFPVSAVSLAVAAAVFERGRKARDAFVARIRFERAALFDLLTKLGGSPRRSEGNFVFAELGSRSQAVRESLIADGILVRLVASSGAPRGLRISLPGDAAAFARLEQAVGRALVGTAGPS